MNSVVRQLLEQNTDVVMVDTGDSYEGICGYYKGTYIAYSKEKPISMNPFKVTKEEYELNFGEKKNFLKSLIFLIFHLTGSFIGDHLSLTFPSFYIPAAKKFVSLPLADEFRIILVGFQLPDNSGGQVIQECFIWYKMVQKL